MKPLFILIVLMAMVIPVAADQIISQPGNNDTAIQIGGNADLNIDHATINSYGSEPLVTQGNDVPSLSTIGIGDADYTRVIYPGYIAIVPVLPTEKVSVKAGTPVALYTINRLYKHDIMGSQSIPEYDPIWDRINHGSVPFVDKIDHYTTKETLIVSEGADFLIIDNRNIFQSYNLVEVKSELTTQNYDMGPVRSPRNESLPNLWV